MQVIKKKETKYISVKGAKLHNLKNISVDIPRNAFTVISGVSGSGKSSLAFDTIYAEGQRRFVESLSAYARQFLERMHKPDADSITGLPPAIAIEQKQPSRNPRSTVGTSTEVYDYLRLLFGRIGITICKECGEQVKKDTPASVVKDIEKWREGERFYIVYPVQTASKDLNAEIDKIRQLGFNRLVIKKNLNLIDLQEEQLPEKTQPEDLYVLVDRIVLAKDPESLTRITDSVETAFHAGEGRISIIRLSPKKIQNYSSIYECAGCQIVYTEPEPRLFSFNNPFGACPSCQGFGRTIGLDDELIFPDPSRSVRYGAIHPFRTQSHSKYLRQLIKVGEKYGFPLDKPYNELSEKEVEFLWEGKGEYKGIKGFFQELEDKNYKVQNRVMIARYRGFTKCHACGGSRLRTSARQVFVSGMNLPSLIKLPLGKVLDFVNNLNLTQNQFEISFQIILELKRRLQLLIDIGLEYLTLNRLSHTLSGGESQRINLSTALGSSLVGTLYVLDEPSIGLHPRDTQRLLNILFKLRNLGNTIVVVEHDPEVIASSDYAIDMGPAAGEFGGEVTFMGPISEIYGSETSITGKYLSGRKSIEISVEKRKSSGEFIIINEPREHNLKLSQVKFPLGIMTVVTGVSGSGKSTLIHDCLYAGLKKIKGGFSGHVGSFRSIEGYDMVEHIELVDQSSIGKSSRSTPATYTKVFDPIRELFSQTQAAKQMGWKPGHFSFNVAGGRCETCEGEGIITVDMQFLPDVSLECEACKGTRYRKEAREILYNGKSIVDVLNMTVNEACDFFAGISKITRKLEILKEVGLGYLRLGQPSGHLSGGEAQRIKLASHLENYRMERSLFIFDEPTTGLHLEDISNLLNSFNRLVERGHTVIIIEHNVHIIAAADYVIDLGPEAGEFGGEIVAEGTPKEVSKVAASHTGRALKKFYEEKI